MNEQPSALSENVSHEANRAPTLTEQERRERRNFLRWNAVVILLVLAGGYEMLMGRMLWKQLEPIQSALAKVGVQMNVTYKQMRGSTIELENPLFKAKIKLSHQVWTLLLGNFFSGSIAGDIKQGMMKQSIHGKVALDWGKTAHVQLKSSGVKRDMLQIEPTELALTLPTEDPKRFALAVQQGKVQMAGGEVSDFKALINADAFTIPHYHQTFNGKRFEVHDVVFSPASNALNVREGVMDTVAFKALSVVPQVVGDGLQTEVNAQWGKAENAAPVRVRLQQKLSFFERNMAQNNPVMAWGLMGKTPMMVQVEMPSEAAFQSAWEAFGGHEAWQAYFVEHHGAYHTIATFNPKEQTFSLKHP